MSRFYALEQGKQAVKRGARSGPRSASALGTYRLTASTWLAVRLYADLEDLDVLQCKAPWSRLVQAVGAARGEASLDLYRRGILGHLSGRPANNRRSVSRQSALLKLRFLHAVSEMQG